jgi:Uncharacterised nucleotidyltransferase
MQRLVGMLCQLPLDDRTARTELAAALARAEPADLAASKLSYLLLQLAEQWDVPLSGAQSAELARLRRREYLMDQELALIASALGSVEYLLLRGRALGRFYPQGWARQYNDIDILVRDERAVPAALDELARHGYYVARPVVSRAAGRRIWLGMALNKHVPGLEHPMYLDVTTLGPALSSTRHLSLPAAAWRTAGRIEVNGVPVRVPGTAWQAALLAAELAERRGDYILRDVLDLAMMDRAGVDWRAVGSCLSGDRDAAVAVGAVARLGNACGRAAGSPDTLAGGPLAVSWPAVGRRRRSPRELIVAAVYSVILLVKGRRARLARRLVEWMPTRPWFACGLPVYLLPPWETPVRGGRGRQVAGLAGYRGRVYPLVPPGYSAAVFASSSGKVAAS